jgi:hypothetical protein
MYNLQIQDFVGTAVRYIQCSAIRHGQCLTEGSELDKQDMTGKDQQSPICLPSYPRVSFPASTSHQHLDAKVQK